MDFREKIVPIDVARHLHVRTQAQRSNQRLDPVSFRSLAGEQETDVNARGKDQLRCFQEHPVVLLGTQPAEDADRENISLRQSPHGKRRFRKLIERHARRNPHEAVPCDALRRQHIFVEAGQRDHAIAAFQRLDIQPAVEPLLGIRPEKPTVNRTDQTNPGHPADGQRAVQIGLVADRVKDLRAAGPHVLTDHAHQRCGKRFIRRQQRERKICAPQQCSQGALLELKPLFLDQQRVNDNALLVPQRLDQINRRAFRPKDLGRLLHEEGYFRHDFLPVGRLPSRAPMARKYHRR